MLRWLPFPFVRFSLAWILGLLWGLNHTEPNLWWWSLWVILIFFYFWLTLSLAKITFFQCSYLLGGLAMTIIFMSGSVRIHWSSPRLSPPITTAQGYWGEVVQPARLHDSYRRITLKLEVVKAKDDVFISEQKIHAFQHVHTHKPLKYGDRVLIHGAPSRLPGPQNPYQFNYRKFLERQGVYGQHWLEDADILIIEPSSNRSLQRSIWSLRRALQTRITEYVPTMVAREILGAMLLGNRQQVTDDVEQAFAKSGTLHILAVSGLHLGIIYGFLMAAFGVRRYHKMGRWFFLLLTLLALWLFAMLTGLAPATRRAALMFSVMVVGKHYNRRGNNFNALCLSACLILLLDPNEIYAVGFQLSYLALGSILWLQPKISAWWSPNNKIVKYIWGIISVSLAAQLGVLPISLYYFHQFPVYFLLGNLFMIPTTLVVLLIGSLFLTVGFWPTLSTILGQVLDWLTQGVHFVNQAIANLPGSTISNLWISPLELVFLYAILLLGVVYLTTIRKLWLQSVLWVWSLGLALNFHHTYNPTDEIMVYHLKGSTAIDFISKARYQSFLSKGVTIKDLNYNIFPNRRSRHLRPQLILTNSWSSESYQAWMFHGKLVILVKAPLMPYVGAPIKAHMVILSNNAVNDLNLVNQRFRSEWIIVDGSNHLGNVEMLTDQAQKMNITFHNTDQRAFRLTVEEY